MPAGDLVTQDWEFEIRATLFGSAASPVQLSREASIGGLGVYIRPGEFVPYDAQDGGYSGPDFNGPTVLTLPLNIKAATPGLALLALETLRATAWAKSATDIPLHMQLPGLGKFFYNGRPRGLDLDTTTLTFGYLRVLAVFQADDPTRYT